MSGAPAHSPPFDVAVASGGYAWWYLDAGSDDGRHGLTVIAFVGSVFSPFYAAARRRGAPAAIEHCAINVALYGQTKRWAMTERGRDAVRRTPGRFEVGPSRLQWQDGVLCIELDEITVPWPSRLRGSIRVTPFVTTEFVATLDAAGKHVWQPMAPHARVEVDLTTPALRWSGTGYLDSNRGDEPLENGFSAWHWSRSREPNGTTRVFYDAQRRDGTALELALDFDASGRATPCVAPPSADLPPTLWGIRRRVRGNAAVLERMRTVEDTPFYARSMAVDANPAAVQMVHESLSLDRFASRWVQALLPFRMGRRRA